MHLFCACLFFLFESTCVHLLFIDKIHTCIDTIYWRFNVLYLHWDINNTHDWERGVWRGNGLLGGFELWLTRNRVVVLLLILELSEDKGGLGRAGVQGSYRLPEE